MSQDHNFQWLFGSNQRNGAYVNLVPTLPNRSVFDRTLASPHLHGNKRVLYLEIELLGWVFFNVQTLMKYLLQSRQRQKQAGGYAIYGYRARFVEFRASAFLEMSSMFAISKTRKKTP